MSFQLLDHSCPLPITQSNKSGIAVSSSGRLFSNYPPGLDGNNTINGQNGKYTIAELFDDNTGKLQ